MMTPAPALTEVVSGQADDLFIVCNSFEERCLESTSRARDYKARCGIVVNFYSQTDLEGERRKRDNLTLIMERLKSIDDSGVPRLILVPHHDYFSLISRVMEELRFRNILANQLRITVDMSCFTRSQLVFLVKAGISEWASQLRLLYTLPGGYNTSGERLGRLSRGYLEPIPLSVSAGSRDRLGQPFRVAVAVIGHEGQRIMSAWQRVDPGYTTVIIPKSDEVAMRSIALK